MNVSQGSGRLRALIHALVELGEDERELQFWNAVFDDLAPVEQEQLLASLAEEARKLGYSEGDKPGQ